MTGNMNMFFSNETERNTVYEFIYLFRHVGVPVNFEVLELRYWYWNFFNKRLTFLDKF